MHWYIINLDRRPDRWESVKAHFEACGFDFVRVSAVDAQSFPPSLRIVPPHEPASESSANFNHIGCSLSHVGLLEQLARLEDDDTLLIAEDDVRFLDPDLVRIMVKEFSQQTTCGMVNFGFGQEWQPVFKEQVSPHLFRCEGKSIRTHAYAVKKSFAKQIASQIREGAVRLAVGGDRRVFGCDVVWTQTPGLLHCIPEKPVALQTGSDSDIETIRK